MKMKRYKLLLIALLVLGCEKDNVIGNKIVENNDFETINGTDERGNPTELTGDGISSACYGQNFYRAIVENILISDYNISAPYPNPFKPTTQIDLSINSEGEVKIFIINNNFESIKTLLNSTLQAGTYSITWDGTDNSGEVVNDGYYRIIIDFGNTECFANLHLTNPL